MKNKQYLIQEVANDLKLKLSDEEINSITNQWNVFNDALDIINKIDTTNVENTYSPNFTPIEYLREDEFEEIDFDKNVIFKNTKRCKNNLFIMEKVHLD